MRIRSFAARIALAAMLVAALSLALVAVGVLVIGASVFDRLMAEHGASAAVSHAMFNDSITRVLVAASAVALAGSLILAAFLGRVIERPLDDLARAARGVAAGDYSARVERPRPPELASVADSFNQMAASLADQERERADLVANFAHELRTPLSNLHGYLAGLRDGVIPPGPEVFASLQDEVLRLMRLSDSLDVLVGAERRPEPVELDLVPTLRSLLQLHEARFAAASISVHSELPPRAVVIADPDAIAQVIGNLLQNAARYTPDGGTVWVRCEQERKSVLVSVANTGSDIPPGELAHVFERFYRVEKSRARASGGAGIGLAIVKQLVESVGGEVGAESAGGTTRFWVRLLA